MCQASGEDYKFPWLSESNKIQKEITQIESELEHLPDNVPAATPWTLGFQSKQGNEPNTENVISVSFDKPEAIDLVAIIPAVRPDNEGNYHPLGFPTRFLLECVMEDDTREPIADYSKQDYPIQGIEPQLFRCTSEKRIKGLRLIVFKVPKHDTWWNNQLYRLAISEIMAFNGAQNVALQAKVSNDSSFDFGYIWSTEAINDGFFTFSPINRKIVNPQKTFMIFATNIELVMDLGSIIEIDAFQLWPVVLELQHNLLHGSGIGFPRNIKIEVLDSPMQKKGEVIYQSPKDFPRPGATPFMRRLPTTSGRYFRFKLGNVFPDFRIKRPARIALAELQLFSKGACVSAGIAADIISFKKSQRDHNFDNHKVKFLTDGRTDEGRIIPLREWVEKFSHRKHLERELAILLQQKKEVEQKERQQLQLIIVTAIGMIIILILLVWVVRLLASRNWAKTREQIASDLHDQIGANLSSIANSHELIRRTIANPTKIQSELLDDTTVTARATADEARQIVKILEGRLSSEPLTNLMKKSAQQILGDIKYSYDIRASAAINSLNPLLQWDLLLFFKEALNNITKHAEAKHVRILLKKAGRKIQLSISDDGQGISESSLPLHHLESRAKRMRGTMKLKTESGKGTQITLTF